MSLADTSFKKGKRAMKKVLFSKSARTYLTMENDKYSINTQPDTTNLFYGTSFPTTSQTGAIPRVFLVL